MPVLGAGKRRKERQMEPCDPQQPAWGERAHGERPRAGTLSSTRWPWQVHREGPDLASQQSAISHDQATIGNLRGPVSRARGLGWFLGQENRGGRLRPG